MVRLHINTPLVESLEMGEMCQAQVFLKMDSSQPSGSFKNRGIGALCSYYAENEHPICFISSSGGNAGLAVAYSGRKLDIPVTVIIPETTPPLMAEKIRREGAEVIVHGKNWNLADQLARELAVKPNFFYVPPFDHPLIWKGHASIIHEIQQAGIKPDAIVVSVGGGGLFCGIIQGLEEVGWSDLPVFTAQTEGAASFSLSVQKGELVEIPEVKTIATSLGVKKVVKEAWVLAQKHPVFPCIVTDQQALGACFSFAEHMRVLVEPACGASLSLIYNKRIDPTQYKKIVVIVCGGCGVTIEMLKNWQKILG